jgi:hypothetical protein
MIDSNELPLWNLPRVQDQKNMLPQFEVTLKLLASPCDKLSKSSSL